jgi:hypothetical protein
MFCFRWLNAFSSLCLIIDESFVYKTKDKTKDKQTGVALKDKGHQKQTQTNSAGKKIKEKKTNGHWT